MKRVATRDKSPADATEFYESALSRAERMRLPKARRAEGVDEEIALLRVRLHRMAKEEPEKLELLLKGVNSLSRLVALKYKLSDKPAEELSKNIAGLLRGIGGALEPELFNGI